MTGHIILTGGAGYIGSHICVQLLQGGYDVTIIDNFSNAHPESVSRISRLTNKSVSLIEADLASEAGTEKCRKALAGKTVDGTVHLAGLKAVGESVALPLGYYQNNISSTINLLKVLEELNAKRIVFSSSATVYGEAETNPVTEEESCKPTNPYGQTKFFIETILKDLQASDKDWQVINLRYFNPVGAHVSGEIGEDPHGVPNNLFPFVAQVAAGMREEVRVFGGDYSTIDGTGVRDYIHVEDLAAGHLSALTYMGKLNTGCALDINLGTGIGYSVLQVVEAFGAAAGRALPYRIGARRHGDIAQIFADARRANTLLGWHATRDLAQMCADHWRWQKNNPNGYA